MFQDFDRPRPAVVSCRREHAACSTQHAAHSMHPATRSVEGHQGAETRRRESDTGGGGRKVKGLEGHCFAAPRQELHVAATENMNHPLFAQRSESPLDMILIHEVSTELHLKMPSTALGCRHDASMDKDRRPSPSKSRKKPDSKHARQGRKPTIDSSAPCGGSQSRIPSSTRDLHVHPSQDTMQRIRWKGLPKQTPFVPWISQEWLLAETVRCSTPSPAFRLLLSNGTKYKTAQYSSRDASR